MALGSIFEVPSNYLLKKMRPSRWIAFLMFSWGAVTIGLGGANSFAAVTGVRFLLGIFEAGKLAVGQHTSIGAHKCCRVVPGPYLLLQ